MASGDAVTIVLPNHHEPQLQETISQLRWALSSRGLQQAKLLVVEDPTGHGVGWALREGVAHVTTPWTIFAMADGSEDPNCLVRMVERCSLLHDPHPPAAVFGDRWCAHARLYAFPRNYPTLKRRLNRLGNHAIAWLADLDRRYTDWTDLAKGYQTEILQRLSWSDDFRCEIEIPVRYLRAWCTAEGWPISDPPPIAVFPMLWRERRAGCSTFQLRRLGSMLWTLVRVCLEV